MSGRPPRTSYGYLAPPGARVRGWRCEHCSRVGDAAPRSWPHPCPECGAATDAVFEEPWAHEARGYQIRHALTSADKYERMFAESEQYVWAYKDARLRADDAAADAAWRAYWGSRRDRRGDGSPAAGEFELIDLAVRFDDLNRAAEELLAWYPVIDTRAVAQDSGQRATARGFISLCIEVLEDERSVDRPWAAMLDDAMRELYDRHEDIPMPGHADGMRRIGEMRARHRARAGIAAARRSVWAATDCLPPISTASPYRGRPVDPAVDELHGLVGPIGINPWRAMTIADAALEAAEVHGDAAPLDRLLKRLEESGGFRALAHLVRGRRLVATGDLTGALAELEQALHARDLLLRWLRPQIKATRGMLLVRSDPGRIDDGIALCRDGRADGLRWWRRTTAADTSLARLLTWRAEGSRAPLERRMADVREAVRLARRRCRPWNVPSADDRLVLYEALAAHDSLVGGRRVSRRHQAWRREVGGSWSLPERARLAQAWAEWAVSTGDPALAAEAYLQLVDLAARDAVTRYGRAAKQRVLAAAQEHVEEAGYWLARTGNYREAVLVLETGRAVGLTEVLGRDTADLRRRLHEAGRDDLADEYERAVQALATSERSGSDGLRQSWAHARSAAGRISQAIGVDPLAPEVSYDDIIAETGDGALTYIAAASAGGYALVVAARHDPQFVEMPRLDRSKVAAMVGALMPSGETPEPVRGYSLRDLPPLRQPARPVADGLRALWNDGLRDLLLLHARGPVVTFVPVGLLSLLPLHAAGDDGNEFRGPMHAGTFSAVRYAPNVRSLHRCREVARALPDADLSLLAADVPDGAGLGQGSHLRHVARETQEVATRWAGTAREPMHACAWEQFRAAADGYTVWHLACHGAANPRSILDTRLCFRDDQITLARLRTELPAGRRRLAVLSACRTNLTDAELPNEVIGLPTALLEAGFAGVIASAWPVDDLATTYLMTAFYRRWRDEGDEPAVALNRAQEWLRTATAADLRDQLPGLEPEGDPGEHPYADPRFWAAFAFTGA